MLPIYFISLDSFRRNYSNIFGSKIVGPFLAGGLASIAAWSLTWPLVRISLIIIFNLFKFLSIFVLSVLLGVYAMSNSS